MNTVELASRILTQLGFYQEPSREIGIDCRRDNIVHLIEEYTHPAELTDEEIDSQPFMWVKLDEDNQVIDSFSEDARKSNYLFNADSKSDLWKPLYFYSAKTLTDEEILDICIMGGFYDRIDDPFFDKKTGAWSLDEDLIEFARAILRKAQEK